MRPEELIKVSFGGVVIPEPTGDRFTDLVLNAFAGNAVADYAGEIEPVNYERKWAHAVLSGAPMPPLVLPANDGYELAHAIFYSTDFGRKPITNQTALNRVMNAIASETDADLLVEYGMCVKALGGTVPSKCSGAIDTESTIHHLKDVSNILQTMLG